MGSAVKRFIALAGICLLCILASFVVGARMAWAIVSNPVRAWNIALAYDRLANVAANDDSGQWISTRAYIAKIEGKRWGVLMTAALDAIDPGHCKAAYEGDKLRAAIPGNGKVTGL